ncbi:CYTH domain-containing protein [Lysinibacillus sp. RC79]|uniref:CYTH domain-containing protein n=1 Tax=Lysinibacillus sp. RC79 TaxID=3156296 RepID=UPI0035131007
MQEIERKFLIVELPKGMSPFETKKVYQNYLTVHGMEEVRIRKQVEGGIEKFDMSYKSGSGMIRNEIKFNISKEAFVDLDILALKPGVEKYRRFFDYKGHDLMIDIFVNPELVVAEIEFESEQQAKEFIPPSWFGEEVTHSKEYKTKNIWRDLIK